MVVTLLLLSCFIIQGLAYEMAVSSYIFDLKSLNLLCVLFWMILSACISSGSCWHFVRPRSDFIWKIGILLLAEQIQLRGQGTPFFWFSVLNLILSQPSVISRFTPIDKSIGKVMVAKSGGSFNQLQAGSRQIVTLLSDSGPLPAFQARVAPGI